MPVGKKATDAFKRSNYPIKSDFTEAFINLNFEFSRKASEWMREAYINGEYDRIEIIYSQFKNAATQNYKVERFLPVLKTEQTGKSSINYIFEPDQDELINELIPRILNTQFFKVLLDSNAVSMVHE
jgi:F-type H+-transporting ATPase subunit gamma